MDILKIISREISNSTGKTLQLSATQRLAGGSINQTIKASSADTDYFIKLNGAELLDMFKAETAGLQELRQAQAISVPEVICSGSSNEYAWLVLEYIPLGGGNAASFSAAGNALAQLHRKLHNQFGWHRDNTIGSTLQINAYRDDWISFWQQNRLAYQIKLAKINGYSGEVISNVERLIESASDLLSHSPLASLLHGDLWSGNLSFDTAGKPVIYDPAVYYGDREADLAMTELFGGFSQHFYAAYQDAWPMSPGYNVRKVFYNLYHILNHMNLFGGGYHQQAVSMSQRLLSEIR